MDGRSRGLAATPEGTRAVPPQGGWALLQSAASQGRACRTFEAGHLSARKQACVSRTHCWPHARLGLRRYEHGGATFRVFVNGVTGDAFGIEQRSVVGEAWAALQVGGRWLDHLQKQCKAMPAVPGEQAVPEATCARDTAPPPAPEPSPPRHPQRQPALHSQTEARPCLVWALGL